jgi:hypothetical protein
MRRRLTHLNRIGGSIIVVCAVRQGGAALQGKKMGKEGLRREHRMCSLEIDMTPAAGACTRPCLLPVRRNKELSFWGILCCGMCVVAASLASNDNFNTNNVEASAANFSLCNTHSDCFAIGATCLSSVPAEIIDNLAHRPCLTCSASYNVGTAPRMCINGACCCTSDSVVFGVVPRVHLAQYEHSTCGHEGSNCHVEVKL